MLDQQIPKEANYYTARLRLNGAGDPTQGSSSIAAEQQPIIEGSRTPPGQPLVSIERPLIPFELAELADRNASIASMRPAATQATQATQATGAADTTSTTSTTSTTHQATGNRLTAANLERKNRRYDSDLHTLQGAARAHAVQKAGKEQGFDLPIQNYLNDRQDFVGWLAQRNSQNDS